MSILALLILAISAAEGPANTDRPDWVDQPAALVGNVYRVTAVSDPCLTKRECDASLDAKLVQITSNYLEELAGADAREAVRIDPAYVRRAILKREFSEIVETTVGPMHRVHVLVEFDEAARRELRERWKDAMRRVRLFQTGGGAMIVLALLGTIFGYLKLDAVTGGLYAGRLQVATAAAILAIVLAAWIAL